MLQSDTCDVVWIFQKSANNISPSEVDLFEENLFKTQVFTQTYAHILIHTQPPILPGKETDWWWLLTL